MAEVLTYPSGINDSDQTEPDLKAEVIRGIQLLAETDDKGRKLEQISPLRAKSAANIISILEKIL
jgi:hypothetical protein